MKIEYNPRKAKRKEAKLSTAPEVVKGAASVVKPVKRKRSKKS